MLMLADGMAAAECVVCQTADQKGIDRGAQVSFCLSSWLQAIAFSSLSTCAS